MPSTVVKPGELWQLGSHRLICGSCQDLAVIERVCGSTTIDAVVTDPPYGVNLVGSKRGLQRGAVHRDILNDQLQTDDEYKAFSKLWLTAIIPHLSSKNSWYIFNSDKMLFALKDGLDEVGIHFGQLLIWVKSQPVVGRLDYLPQHELIVYGWYGRHAFHKSKDKSVLFYPKPHRSRLHPSTKPVGLVRHLILNSTKIGDAVWDGFLGSGTAILACEQTQRRCLAVELDPRYCSVAVDRWENLTGSKAKRL